ncbi:hypothetical protein OH76DRAFT_1405751 [Lentinus brumalis]|uniref:Uncharacterized protein n=1 Tax=Lentinus brumalis TaxID=2498619 RepID=A0A371D555_9APHY|nr:hypothetical protein OH76DRAFT_1405751 [Polyporus brumalis]
MRAVGLTDGLTVVAPAAHAALRSSCSARHVDVIFGPAMFQTAAVQLERLRAGECLASTQCPHTRPYVW